MAIIGYARTLMVDDDVDPQVAALRDAGRSSAAGRHAVSDFSL